MTYETLLPLVLYAAVTSATPGPNNLMLMASGANFGVVRTLPHLSGVSLGFVLMTIMIGAGLIQILQSYPVIQQAMQVICFGFVLYLAWRIATASPPDEDQPGRSRPLHFLEAAAFQWVNPKAIAMSVTTITAYSQDQTLLAITLAAGTFGLINFPFCSLWVLLGQQLKIWLKSRLAFQIFNAVMAALLVVSMIPMLLKLTPI